jgi:hypothetical protein
MCCQLQPLAKSNCEETTPTVVVAAKQGDEC